MLQLFCQKTCLIKKKIIYKTSFISTCFCFTLLKLLSYYCVSLVYALSALLSYFFNLVFYINMISFFFFFMSQMLHIEKSYTHIVKTVRDQLVLSLSF